MIEGMTALYIFMLSAFTGYEIIGRVPVILHTHGGLINRRAGTNLKIVAVSARDQNKDRGVDLSGIAFETDPVAFAARDDVDVVVDLLKSGLPALLGRNISKAFQKAMNRTGEPPYARTIRKYRL